MASNHQQAVVKVKQLGFGFYEPLKLVYCSWCKKGLLLDALLYHVSTYHKPLQKRHNYKADVDFVLQALEAHPLSFYRSNASSGLLKGQPLCFLDDPRNDGYICNVSDCKEICNSIRSKQRHQYDNRTHDSYSTIEVQTLLIVSREKPVFYVVTRDTYMVVPNNPVGVGFTLRDKEEMQRLENDSMLVAEKEKNMRQMVTIDPQDSPWIRFTSWKEILQGDNLIDAKERLPNIKTCEREYPWAVKILRKQLGEYMILLGELSNDIRIMLKNGDPDRETAKPVRIVEQSTFIRFEQPDPFRKYSDL
ncbi:hypothetical protein BJ508DRAFT_314240 [Ascobolus immersus RN42]|uniref:Uncharacterized protein n=1 Tax=Ascobolus immersus RN42 TaxID=1160509 RepID=A0A3N4HTI5_ASCIM|nr:hypothetical protein BJ508DRAFT_314240 [Ascobolus immersus RN42]